MLRLITSRPTVRQTVLGAAGLARRAQAASMAAEGMAGKDESLLRLFLSVCGHRWAGLPALAQRCLDAGASAAELQGCVRHICVVAGYPPSLAAAKKLAAAGLLSGSSPGKAGGQPGDAFHLVYADKADRVWRTLYGTDPVLAEWIQAHCYGDIYSSPGLDLRQKQLLTAAFLAEAGMADEFFGHVLAALRFGASLAQLQQAVELAFELAGSAATKQEERAHALRLTQKAAHKVAQAFPGGVPPLPAVALPEPASVRLPEPPPALGPPYFETV